MEKERLKFSIERFDHYYDSIHNKGSVYLALATFIVGGLIAGYTYLKNEISSDVYFIPVMFSIIGLGLVIMILVVLAFIPYTPDDSDSLIYFASISKRNVLKFHEDSKTANEESELYDLRNQVFQLANGLNRKYQKMRLVGILFIIQFSLFLPLVFLIIINQKQP